jgi:hypothetical protein
MVDKAPEGTSTGGIKGLGDALGSNFDPIAIAKVVLTLDNAASEMLKKFGQGQAMSDLLRGSMAEAVTSVRKLGGDIADVLATQKDASETLGRNVVLSEKTTKDLYATMKVTGQSVKDIVAGMADAGIGAGRATSEMLKVVNVARESGVNAQAVSGAVIKNMEALNKFNFAGGVEGLAKMAAQSTALRVDMGKTLELADRLFDPEKAIDLAASMQRLGVSQSSLLDPLKLMDLAQNDPAELQNQIAQMSKQFVQLGKDGHFEIMPGAKRQLREISSAMGISYNDITKMALGSADLDKKMKEISFPSATEDQKKMIANMAEMGAGGTYEIKTAAGETKDVSKLTGPEIEALEKMANTAPPTMEELAKQQLTATQSITAAINSLADRTGLGAARSETAGGILKGTRAVATAASEIPGEGLSAKNIAQGIDNTVDSLKTAIAKYAATGEKTDVLGNIMSSFGGFVKKELMDSFSNVQVQADKLSAEFPMATGTIKAFNQMMAGTLPPSSTNSSIPRGTVGTSSSQVSNQKSTMDVNLNVKVDSNSPNIDAKQMEQIFTNPALMEKLTVSVRDGINKMNPVKNERP